MKNCFWLFILFAGLAHAQTYTIQTVPNVKLIDNTYVSDPDSRIGSETVTQLNQKLATLEQQTTAQVAVVLLTSIGTETDVDFAQNLFRLWSIGNSGNDNGLLILYVEDQRVIRFHTGYGLEGILPDVICKRIQQQYMIPKFREGNIDAGMLAGVEEVIKIISNPEYASEVMAQESAARSSLEWFVLIFMIAWFVILVAVFLIKVSTGFFNSKESKLPSAALSIGQWLLLMIVAPTGLAYLLGLTNSWILLLGGLYVYFNLLVVAKYKRIINRALNALGKSKSDEVQKFMKEHNSWSEWAMLFPLPFAFLGGGYKKIMQGLRTHPRKCQKCSGKMALIPEVNKSNRLTEQQQFEEKIQSITYYIWQCNSCDSSLIEKNPNDKKYYAKCPKCGTWAFQSTQKTLKKPTLDETGLLVKVSKCKYCNHTVESESTMPMLQKRQRVYDSESSSNDNDSSWSSSSDSDSGGSWGGGDSGGGGASSRW